MQNIQELLQVVQLSQQMQVAQGKQFYNLQEQEPIQRKHYGKFCRIKFRKYSFKSLIGA